MSGLRISPAARRTGVVGRYAPSPSGPQHLGNLRTALVAWLQARLEDGVFIVRMEDLDTPRVREGSAAAIAADLAWLGLDADESPQLGGPCAPYTQSERLDVYGAVHRALDESGHLFACTCSRKDIRNAASAPHGSDGAIYPGTCRHGALSHPERSAAWRLRVDDHVVEFDDALAGPQRFPLQTSSGDFVVRRADGVFAYQLAVAVDDALMGVTDVVRGDDLLDSTPRQIFLLKCLGLAVPRYWHVPVLCDANGERLSKRDGSMSLAALRESGSRAEDVIAELAFGLGLVSDRTPLGANELLKTLTPELLRQRVAELARVGAPEA